MVAEDFIAAKQPTWARLQELLSRVQKRRLQALSAAELTELGRLYRQVTSDLAVARRDFPGHRVVDFLNNLVGRAHGEIYRNEATTAERIRNFVQFQFPQTWRATLPFTLVAFAFFVLPAAISFGWIIGPQLLHPSTTTQPPPEVAVLFPGADQLAEMIKSHTEWWKEINTSGRGANATFIMSNNILVALKAFAGGMLLGLGTIYAMVQNGLMLGVTAGLAHFYGFSDRLWGFILPHAPLELSVIFFAGGAGLQLAWAVIHPGLLARGAALRAAARRAIVIMLGCVPLLVMAGTIEGFISPSAMPLGLKLLISLGTGVALYSYLIGIGRPKAGS